MTSPPAAGGRGDARADALGTPTTVGVTPTDAASSTTGPAVLRGGAWNLLALLLPQLFVLVLSVAAARYLGPDTMGRQSFIAFVQITAVAVVGLGVPVALMRTVAEGLGEGRAGEVRGLLRWARPRMAVAAAAAALAVGSGALVTGRDATAWLLAAGVALVAVLQSVPAAVLLGMQRWRAAATAGLVTGFVSLCAVVPLLAAGGGLVVMFAVELAAGAVNLVWTSLLAHRALSAAAGAPRSASDLPQRLVRFARPQWVLTLLEIVVWKRSEFFVLARYSGSGEIAQYSIAFAGATALAQLPGALTGITSSFATLHGAGQQDRIRSGFTRGTRLLLVLVLPATAAATALAPSLVLVVYGEDYQRAATVLQVLLVAFPVVALSGLAEAVLTGRGELRWQLRATVAAVPVNIGLALLLIPEHGAVGAAAANVAGQLVATAPVLWRAVTLLGVRRADVVTGRLVAGVALAVTAGLAAHAVDVAVAGSSAALGLAAGAAAFAVVWLSGARAVRVLSREDGTWLADAVTGPVPALGRGVRWVTA